MKNKRLLFGIISIVLAAVIALIGIPMVMKSTNTKVNIVRVAAPIEQGTIITDEQVVIAEVSSHGLPENVATDKTQVVGKFALVDMVAGDYFLPAKVSSQNPETDVILSELPNGKIAVSMSVQSLAGILSNKLRTDDIVRIYRYENGVEKVDELQYVRIIAISNSSGVNIEDVTGDGSRMASTITFLATYEQAMKIIEIENESAVHMVLVSRGDEKEAATLLAEQETILEQLIIEAELAETDSEIIEFETEAP